MRKSLVTIPAFVSLLLLASAPVQAVEPVVRDMEKAANAFIELDDGFQPDSHTDDGVCEEQPLPQTLPPQPSPSTLPLIELVNSDTPHCVQCRVT